MRFTAACVFLVLAAAGGQAPLEAAFEAAEAEQPAERELVVVREEEPWLRIDAGGHNAAVRALAFSPDSMQLSSGGLDKTVQVWNLADLGGQDVHRVHFRQRTIRWQVARGLRGSIYALASAPGDGLLAIGGYGAMGSLGEILLVDPAGGRLERALSGHRQTVCGLAFSADGKRLVSADVEGKVILWSRDAWQPAVLCKTDEENYGHEWAERIALQDKFRPVAVAGSRYAFFPVLAGRDSRGRLQWKVRQVDFERLSAVRDLDVPHLGMVTAMAVSRDGSRLASADLAGAVNVWDTRAAARHERRLDPGTAAASLALAPDGGLLVVGTTSSSDGRRAQLQVWDAAAGRQIRSRLLDDHCFVCAVSPDGKTLAYGGGERHEVFVEPLDGEGRTAELRSKSRPVVKVAFAEQEPFYRVAFGTSARDRGFNDYGDVEESFDPEKLTLAVQPADPPDWLGSDWLSGPWKARLLDDGSLQLLENNVPRGRIVLDARLEGRPRCYCWIPDRNGRPAAVAVGTDVQNSIYVHRLGQAGQLPLLRHFRGHYDVVNSLGVSRDLRYLASGSADGTVRIWSLSGYEEGVSPSSRWGADLAVRGRELVAQAVHEAGPLYGKGLRSGDAVVEIRWMMNGQVAVERRPDVILEKLRTLPWNTQVTFQTRREGEDRPPFQRLPAWEPLASLFVADDREWAFWTPSGYYDASLNGYRLFGWQINRGLERLPDYYRADQFYRRLERPDVLEHLLPAGSLPAAFRQAAAALPASELHQVLPELLAAAPRVTILSPAPGTEIGEDVASVTARIEVPPEGKLARAKAFANGVVAREAEQLEERQTEEGTEITYRWEVPLPKAERNLIQVVADTDFPAAAFGEVLIGRPEPPVPKNLGRAFVVAVGVNDYADAGIAALAFPVADAESVIDAFQRQTEGLYHCDPPVLLINEEVTPENWREALERVRGRLREAARPDDLLVVFLAGHGEIGDDNRYYFVGHELKIDDFRRGEYGDCISWDDFRALFDIPCHKLALIDTCHAGALQPESSRRLKQAVRAFQEDVIFTITASTGDQRSQERSSWGHGAFTKCLLEGLAGSADESQDGVVTVSELVAHVHQAVARLTDGQQTPTAAPDELLPYIWLPLSRPSAAAAAGASP